jgi:hypothetical protein
MRDSSDGVDDLFQAAEVAARIHPLNAPGFGQSAAAVQGTG